MYGGQKEANERRMICIQLGFPRRSTVSLFRRGKNVLSRSSSINVFRIINAANDTRVQNVEVNFHRNSREVTIYLSSDSCDL